MSEARCAVCEHLLAPGDWVYTTRREDKWVHGSCLDVFSAHYWPDEAPPRGSDAGDDNDRGEDAANPSSRVSRPTRRARR